MHLYLYGSGSVALQSVIRTLAVADVGAPERDRPHRSVRDALEIFGETAVGEHEARVARGGDDTAVEHVRSYEMSVHRRIQLRTDHFYNKTYVFCVI